LKHNVRVPSTHILVHEHTAGHQNGHRNEIHHNYDVSAIAEEVGHDIVVM